MSRPETTSDMTSVWLVLLLCASALGEASADEPLETVSAFVGFPATLPCLQKLSRDTEVPTIEWSRRGLVPPYVFVYRQNFEVYEEKHPDFEFRTHLFMTKLQHGNFSMRLSSARRSDAGTYVCKTIWDKDKQDVREVRLVVEELPEPELSVVWSQSGEVYVSCEVQTCSPVVLIILDGHGNVLEAEKTELGMEESSSECPSVKQNTSVKADGRRVVCRAEFSEVNHSRETHVLIPDSCTIPTVFAIGTGTVLAILILAGLGFLLCKLCSRSSEKARPPTDEPASELSHLLSRDGPSTAIEIPDETQNTLTQQPDLLSTTPDSIGSNAGAKNSSVFVLFADQANANANRPCDRVDEKPATCEFNVASKTVTFNDAKQGNDPSNGIPAKESVTQNQANGVSKPAARRFPLQRSQSASEPTVTMLSGSLKSVRRHSLSSKFEKLKEENPEKDF